MAKSGSGRVGSSWNSSYGLQFYWSCSQSIEGNYSDFTVDVYASFSQYATITVGARSDSYMEIGGNRETKNFPAITKMDSPAKDVYLGTKTQRIYHNNEGKLDNVYLYAYWPIRATISGTYRESVAGGMNTGAIDTIPRASVLSTINAFNLGSNVTVPITRYSSSFRDDLYVTLNGVNIAFRSGISTSYTLTLSAGELNEIYSRIPSSNSADLVFTIYTYNGTTQIGSSAKTVRVTVVNSNPTFNTFTYFDGNTTVANITGNNQVIVKSKSNLTVQLHTNNKMVTKNYATPSHYIITCDDKNTTVNYSANTIDVGLGNIASSGIKRLTVKAVDSRGNSTSAYFDIEIKDYNSVQSNVTVTRLNNFENQTTITMNGLFNLLPVSGVNKNTISSIKYRYAEAGKTMPSTWTTMSYSLSGNSFAVTNVVLNLDNGKAFTFEFEIVDKLEATYIYRQVDIGKALMFLDADTGDLEVMGDVYAKGKKLGNMESILLPASTNLNNIQQEGLYYCPLNVDAATMSNVPYGSTAFSLLVEKHAGCKQTFTIYPSGTPMTWIRNYYNGSWGSWKRVAFISYGTGSPGTLMDGEIYVRY